MRRSGNLFQTKNNMPAENGEQRRGTSTQRFDGRVQAEVHVTARTLANGEAAKCIAPGKHMVSDLIKADIPLAKESFLRVQQMMDRTSLHFFVNCTPGPI